VQRREGREGVVPGGWDVMDLRLGSRKTGETAGGFLFEMGAAVLGSCIQSG
jgi:hypothetical protein